jgi:hypothetical protein
MHYSTVQLGTSDYRGSKQPIFLGGKDRLRHMYVLGKTGVGKSSLYANMALSDILSNAGVCFIDPHGESVNWILDRIPEGRLEDVILFDPSETNHPFGLNLLEADEPSEKDFLVSELIAIFYKLFDPEKTGIIGPQFEHWLRNAALTIMAGPEGGSILEIPKLFVDKRFELYKRKFVTDPLVQEFWSGQMSKTSDFHRSEMLNYFSSKFGHFLGNSVMRNILGQTKSSINFHEIISKEKILLVDLSKGKLGETNAYMLGLILISKLQAAILKRAHVPEEERYPHYLYVDEFQNLTTDTFASMLSESRKYGLAVHITNQYFAQLPRNIQTAIVGNVGTMLCFQIGSEDAETLEKEFAPFTKEDLTNLARYHFYIKLQIQGQTSQPFSGLSLPPKELPDKNLKEQTRTLSQLAYGSPKLLVEELLKKRLR